MAEWSAADDHGENNQKSFVQFWGSRTSYPWMTERDDDQLLAEFASAQSETAFAALVSRHVNLVYSTALRFASNPHHAEEITQAVFIILARKAGGLRRGTVLSGWLYQTARLTAANFVKGEIRRQNREQEAYMQSTLTEPAAAWEQIAPLLDEAMGHLGETDRNAVVLRFFENKTAQEIAVSLKLNEAAAHKRVTRGLEKLRKYFVKRGVPLTAALLAGTVAAHSVQAAPPGLALTVAAATAKGAAVSASTLTLVKGALKIMAWSKAQTAIVAGAIVLLAAGTTTLVTTKMVEKSKPKPVGAIYEELWSHPNSDSLPALEKAPPALIIRPTRYPNKYGGVWANDGKGFWVNGNVASIIGIAYDQDAVRTVFPDSVPEGTYDVMESLPPGQNTPALQEEITKQFGLSAHKEIRETDVLLLQVSDPAKLRSHLSNGRADAYMTGDAKTQHYHLKNETPAGLATNLESWFGLPIVDRSGSANRYSFEFQWANKLTGTKGVAATLREQLGQVGLELVPGQESIEMLMVEKGGR